MAGLDIPTLRAELAKFLPNERLIRAFEQLGETVDENVDLIEIVGAVADQAYFLGFASAANMAAPSPDMLLALPSDAPVTDGLLPIPDASPMLPKMESGAYTPTLTNVANIDASASYPAQWLRLGDVVTLSGKVDIDPTATGATTLALTLPLASNIGSEEQCAGTAACGSLAGQSAAIVGDPANDRALLSFVATDTANRSWFYSYTYKVI